MKKKVFYFLIFLIFFSLLELLSFFIINKIKNSQEFLYFKKFSIENEILEKKYSEFIPYSRSKLDFNEYNNYVVDKSNHSFFSVIKNFSNRNSKNILIQGDSWAEIASHKKVFNFLKLISEKKNYGLINAGISSYSPSPMTAQLFILNKEFNLKPTTIVAIIDQTDFGDELYRYSSIGNKKLSLTLTNIQKNFYKDILQRLNNSNFSSFKLARFFNDYFFFQKEIYNLSSIQTINLILKKVKSKIFNVPILLFPLKYGVNNSEKNIFKNRLNNYIEVANLNKKLDKIYFVTHPHKNHLGENPEYIFNVKDVIDEIINESKFKKKLKHIDFSKIQNGKDSVIYEEKDIFSHLTVDAYSNYYYPSIFEAIK